MKGRLEAGATRNKKRRAAARLSNLENQSMLRLAISAPTTPTPVTPPPPPPPPTPETPPPPSPHRPHPSAGIHHRRCRPGRPPDLRPRQSCAADRPRVRHPPGLRLRGRRARVMPPILPPSEEEAVACAKGESSRSRDRSRRPEPR